MKKIIMMLALMLATVAQAKEKKDVTPYLRGAVPQENGIVTFHKSFTVTGKTQSEVHKVMSQYLNRLVENSVEAPTPYARIQMDNQDTIAARCCDFLVFTKKFLVLNRARMRYQISAILKGNHVDMTITAISYFYGDNPQDPMDGVIYRAEEWIDDAHALNKAGTKLLPKSDKFRIHTIDHVRELFEGAMDAFEQKEAPAQPVAKQRNGIVEN